mmetsp:Transcript_980/g.2345  ORF Transcript_980/g.2345 Transcript_980/m.2345 type:complete len:218 (+) Transcript_980:564-1217(+)
MNRSRTARTSEGVGLPHPDPASVASHTAFALRLPMLSMKPITSSGQRSRSSDRTCERCTPRDLWMPEHSMQINMPRFMLAQRGAGEPHSAQRPLSSCSITAASRLFALLHCSVSAFTSATPDRDMLLLHGTCADWCGGSDPRSSDCRVGGSSLYSLSWADRMEDTQSCSSWYDSVWKWYVRCGTTTSKKKPPEWSTVLMVHSSTFTTPSGESSASAL